MLEGLSLNTVCREANCPNIGECFKKRTATFLIMGKNCTRHCRFCNISKEPAVPLDPNEPENVAKAAVNMQLRHVVVTSVTRDDLADGGAQHFAETTKEIRKAMPDCTIELLIPDMGGVQESLDTIIASNPDIIAHNMETVRRLTPLVRSRAKYDISLKTIETVAKSNKSKPKSGLMVGLGETPEEVVQTMDDLRAVGCKVLTIGQYLQPTRKHLPVSEFISPDQFKEYKRIGLEKGFEFVESGPLVRSSYRAERHV